MARVVGRSGSHCELIRSTLDYLKLDAQTIEFRVPVEADGEAEIDYTVRYRW